MIYHAYDPLVVLMHARRLLKTNGLIIVETVFRPGDNAALYLNTEVEDPVREPNTYFLPTPRGLAGMLRFIACNPLATIVNVDRLAVLARACRPTEITDGTEALGVCIREGAHYGPLSFDELEEDEAEVRDRARRSPGHLVVEPARLQHAVQAATDDGIGVGGA